MNKLIDVKSTVLTPKQLAERWQISLAKVYEDNNTGLLPQLSSNKNRFPLIAIEEMEKEPLFDKENISTPRERRYKRELDDQQKLSTLKDEEISKLKLAIAKVQSFTTQFVFNIVSEE